MSSQHCIFAPHKFAPKIHLRDTRICWGLSYKTTKVVQEKSPIYKLTGRDFQSAQSRTTPKSRLASQKTKSCPENNKGTQAGSTFGAEFMGCGKNMGRTLPLHQTNWGEVTQAFAIGGKHTALKLYKHFRQTGSVNTGKTSLLVVWVYIDLHCCLRNPEQGEVCNF